MFIRTISALAGAAFAAATLAVSTPVFAAEADQDKAVIYIADLDLNAQTGMAAFERRVRTASLKICGTLPGRDLKMQKLVADCHSQVRASAMSSVELAMKSEAPAMQLALRLN
jgi:UrcA family protein